MNDETKPPANDDTKIEEKIAKVFAYHAPSEAMRGNIKVVKAAYSRLLSTINGMCPDSRDKSLAITHLEDSAMRAVRSMVMNDPESVPEE